MSEGTPVGAHVIKMMGYIQTLEKQGFALNNELVTNVILQSLSDSFKQFILNFNMNDIDKTLPQLLGMLRTAKSNLKKNGSNSIQIVRVAKERERKGQSLRLRPPDMPRWSGVFERRNRTLLDMEFLTNSGKGRNIELKEVQQQQVIEPEVEGISQAVEENPIDLETQPLRRSSRERHEPERYGFLVTLFLSIKMSPRLIKKQWRVQTLRNGLRP
ncbi:hypothetical protein V6N12_033025 [Hibiscus sabdariffa]|uniref:Zinc finger, CCHC-type n=1 Tax=Hibiscus sabdariffa TaxID=183260 RepID=A0ABR2CEU5_9ROSI